MSYVHCEYTEKKIKGARDRSSREWRTIKEAVESSFTKSTYTLLRTAEKHNLNQ